MTLRSLLLLAAFLLPQTDGPAASRPASAPAPPSVLRVMTFNVRYASADDGEDAWAKRSELLFETIRAAAPQVLGVQEALRSQVDELLKALPNMDAFGQGRRGGREDEHCAILVDRERFAVERSGDFWLSESPAKAGSRSWDAALPRMCTWAVLREKDSNARCVVFNTHFDHKGARARAESARLLVERMKAFPAMPKLVLGDLNAEENTTPLETLKAAGLRDTFRALHPDVQPAGTFHAFRGKEVGGKIDYVLCDGLWEVRRAEILRGSKDGRYPSDHFPVMAELMPQRL